MVRPPQSSVCCPVPTAWDFFTGGYADVSGAEGADSCFVASWNRHFLATGNAICSANFTQGAHWLTTQSSRTAADGSDLLSTVLSTAQTPYPGCNQALAIGATATTTSSTPTTWSWADNTNASNLNCGAQACNVWFPGQPEYAVAFAGASLPSLSHVYTSCGLRLSCVVTMVALSCVGGAARLART